MSLIDLYMFNICIALIYCALGVRKREIMLIRGMEDLGY